MKAPLTLAAAATLIANAIPAPAQQAPGLGEVLVTANRKEARYFQQDRPVVGLRRQADAAVLSFSVNSDTREEATRRQEIYTVLLSLIDKAAASGLELVYGGAQLNPVTRANYTDLPHVWGGRVDTSKVDLMVKAPLSGSVIAAQERLKAFVKSAKGSGRATVDGGDGTIVLTVVNPDQYRDQIVSLVADDARHNAALFGPEFTFNLTGIDGQVAWSQVSTTEIFLYIPYRYTIVPK